MNNTSFGGALPAGTTPVWARVECGRDRPANKVRAKNARLPSDMVFLPVLIHWSFVKVRILSTKQLVALENHICRSVLLSSAPLARCKTTSTREKCTLLRAA